MHREREGPVVCCICHYLGLEVITDINSKLTSSQYCLSAICTFHILRMEQGSMCCVLQMSRIAVSIEIVSRSLNHLPRGWLLFYFITSVWLWSIKETDTDLSGFQAFTSFTNPRIHKSTSSLIYESTNPRNNHPIWVCLPLHTVCCQPHFAHCTREDVNETYGTVHCFASVPELQKLALCCFASVKCFVIWFTFS